MCIHIFAVEMKIEDEIQQKEFKSEYQKAHINLLFTASWLSQHSLQVLKPFGLSWQQFNVLRILRGRHPEPATVKLLAERMIDKMSNASRLVEKLKQKGYVERCECPEDRRQVDIRITESGLQALELASRSADKELQSHMCHISEQEAFTLNHILDKIRD